MLSRSLFLIISVCVASCAGTSEVRESVSRPRAAASQGGSTAKAPRGRKLASTMPKFETEPTRDAKASDTELDEWPEDFSGEDTRAPTDPEDAEGPRVVAVTGIRGTATEFDIRTTLENRSADFDRCHDRLGNGGGRIVYRIHILANGDVGGVRRSAIRSRNRKLVDCYTEVVASSHFPQPSGGYADVKWTTKVGRSRKKRPDPMFSRPHRWDRPTGRRAAR